MYGYLFRKSRVLAQGVILFSSSLGCQCSNSRLVIFVAECSRVGYIRLDGCAPPFLFSFFL